MYVDIGPKRGAKFFDWGCFKLFSWKLHRCLGWQVSAHYVLWQWTIWRLSRSKFWLELWKDGQGEGFTCLCCKTLKYFSCQHTAFDGLISITSSYYTFQSLMETNGEWVKPTTIRSLSPPCKLNFVLDAFLREELKSANMRQSISVSTRIFIWKPCQSYHYLRFLNPMTFHLWQRTKVIVIREEFCDFGKSFTVKNRVHPDTFVQMALQLTYYRMHRRFLC